MEEIKVFFGQGNIRLERIKSVAAELACRLDIIPDADHFFQSREKDLAACINEFAVELRCQRQ